MTDIVWLAEKLYKRIEWQSVPDTLYEEDLTVAISDSIRHLYVMTGRALMFNEGMFEQDGTMYVSFSEDQMADEIEYVLVTAEIDFYRKVQSSVDDLVSYTTDAMSVTHGDKPFANLQNKIDDAYRRQTQIWYKMTRYHLL